MQADPKERSETLLIVDDEADVCDMLSTYLNKQSYTIFVASNTTKAREILNKEHVDLMILDINMPGESGLDLLRSIHPEKQLPVILLTANSDTVDKVVGLELGADDYIGKPFDLRELLARIRSVLRRQNRAENNSVAAPTSTNATSGNKMRFGSCVLDTDQRRLFNELNEELPLTAMEFDLLQFFAANPNRVLTRDRLLELSHYRGGDPFDRSIDIRITRIRRKIEKDPAHPQIIKTVRGAGYLFSTNANSHEGET